MDHSLMWWIVCAILVGAELLTGTFYLLVLAAAAAAGALASMLGFGWAAQAVVAAIVGVFGTTWLRAWRAKRASLPNTADNLDVGQTVRVIEWLPDGCARVNYRGTNWDAVLASAEVPKGEIMLIVATRGNDLVLGTAKV